MTGLLEDSNAGLLDVATGASEDCIAAPVCRACVIPLVVRGGSYGVGDDKCHSASNWSSLAPWRRKNIVEGDDMFGLWQATAAGVEQPKRSGARDGKSRSGSTCEIFHMSQLPETNHFEGLG
jgi:hypothetical protein